MKGIFNKVFVIALLVSVCGVRAEVTDLSGKQLLQAAAAKLSKEGTVAVKAGFNAVKNSQAASSAAKHIQRIGSSVVFGVQSVSEKVAPVLAQQTEKITSVGRILSSQATKVAGFSKTALMPVATYAIKAKDAAVNNPKTTAACVVAGLVSFVAFKEWLLNREEAASKQGWNSGYSAALSGYARDGSAPRKFDGDITAVID